MNLVLLSGGSGQRLWPLSNDIRSKQFIKIFHREDGELESMIQRVYRQIKTVDTDATVTIATSKSQVSAIRNQLGEEVGISVEPCRRDTSPAIALAAAYLKDVQGVGEEESVVVCPVDPYVENDYFEALKALGDRAAVSSANLVLMGIEPTYPSEKYGYIIPIGKERVSKVSMFKEKPTQEVAKDYIAKGALWNGGVFAFKLGYVLNRAHELIDFVDYEDLFNKYDTLNKISFDYAVVEHEPEIEVMRFAGTWKDLGTWNTLTEAMDSHAVGEALFNEKCENVHVVNELDVPILCMGLKDVVVSASPEGILVSDKEQSSYIKPFVNTLDHRVMFAEKSWGSFKVIDIDKASMTIKVTLNAGHRMNYHSHQHRDEVWTVIAGEGKTVVDGMEQNVKAGDVITMSAGCRHTIIAETELKLIEVQLGEAGTAGQGRQLCVRLRGKLWLPDRLLRPRQGRCGRRLYDLRNVQLLCDQGYQPAGQRVDILNDPVLLKFMAVGYHFPVGYAIINSTKHYGEGPTWSNDAFVHTVCRSWKRGWSSVPTAAGNLQGATRRAVFRQAPCWQAGIPWATSRAWTARASSTGAWRTTALSG